MADAIITRKGGGGAKINGTVKSYEIASGVTVEAGDFVGINDTNKVVNYQEAKEMNDWLGWSSTDKNEYDIISTTNPELFSNQTVHTLGLSSTLSVIVYTVNGGNSVIAKFIENNGIVKGTETQIAFIPNIYDYDFGFVRYVFKITDQSILVLVHDYTSGYRVFIINYNNGTPTATAKPNIQSSLTDLFAFYQNILIRVHTWFFGSGPFPLGSVNFWSVDNNGLTSLTNTTPNVNAFPNFFGLSENLQFFNDMIIMNEKEDSILLVFMENGASDGTNYIMSCDISGFLTQSFTVSPRNDTYQYGSLDNAGTRNNYPFVSFKDNELLYGLFMYDFATDQTGFRVYKFVSTYNSGTNSYSWTATSQTTPFAVSGSNSFGQTVMKFGNKALMPIASSSLSIFLDDSGAITLGTEAINIPTQDLNFLKSSYLNDGIFVLFYGYTDNNTLTPVANYVYLTAPEVNASTKSKTGIAKQAGTGGTTIEVFVAA